MDQDEKFGTQVGLGLGHIALDGDPAPLPQEKGHSPPNFWAHIYYGQTDGWIKMPLGMEVGLGAGHIVLDGDPAPPKKRGSATAQFLAHVCCGQMAGWIMMPLGTGRLRPRPHCVKKGHSWMEQDATLVLR